MKTKTKNTWKKVAMYWGFGSMGLLALNIGLGVVNRATAKPTQTGTNP